MNVADPLTPEVRKAIADTALFYPCCGQDLDLPIQLFASVVSDFYFVDIRKPRRQDLQGLARLKSPVRRPGNADEFVHIASEHEFRLHRRQRRAEEILDELPKLGVFFYRGDNSSGGEGSNPIDHLS